MSDSSSRSVTLAGFWRRFAAYVIDGIVVGFITVIAMLVGFGLLLLVFPLSFSDFAAASSDLLASIGISAGDLGVPASDDDGESGSMLIIGVRLYLSWMLLQMLMLTPLWVGWLYFALMESSENSATLGKMALNIVVSDRFGRRITFERATGRYFAKIISGFTFGVGYLMAAFSSRKQALHDIIAGCLLLYRGPADYYEDEEEYEQE
ncbi:MAG: RDD family protein [bacterium]|nr:RDD family protein [bacterium]